MKKILVIMAHPNKETLNNALADSYIKGAKESNAEVEKVCICDLQFDPILHKGYKEIQELEPDLKEMQQKISWADHLVFVYPTWWGNVPAQLKGFLDRAFLPGWAFRFHKKGPFWDKLLKGKSARLITTSGSPAWIFWLLFGYAGHNALKHVTLKFCGVSPVKISMFGNAEKASEKTHQKWLNKVYRLGKKMK